MFTPGQQNPTSPCTVSVVVPCYNEQEVITACYDELTRVLGGSGISYELVFVNDGSRDSTGETLRDLHMLDAHVNVVLLSRNFGHQHAVTAGLEFARGDAVVIIDADLQDPPELIPEMLSRWCEGYQVVYGVREHRTGESAFKLWTAKWFYRIIGWLSDIEIPQDTGDFRLLDRKAMNALLSMPERHRVLRAMSSWVGFRQYALRYTRGPRLAGRTKYPFRKMLGLALDGILSFSTVPLRVVTVVGLLSAIAAFIGLIYSIAVRLFTHSWVRGWFTLFFGILFVGAVQMLALGVVGEYVARIYTEVKQRPLYIADEVLQHWPETSEDSLAEQESTATPKAKARGA